jgi:hypothetical protein
MHSLDTWLNNVNDSFSVSLDVGDRIEVYASPEEVFTINANGRSAVFAVIKELRRLRDGIKIDMTVSKPINLTGLLNVDIVSSCEGVSMEYALWHNAISFRVPTLYVCEIPDEEAEMDSDGTYIVLVNYDDVTVDARLANRPFRIVVEEGCTPPRIVNDFCNYHR